MTKRYFRLAIFIMLWLSAMSWNLQAQEVRRHLVRPGETFYSISRRYNISVDDLLKANPGTAGMAVCGAELIIPAPADGDSSAAPSASVAAPGVAEKADTKPVAAPVLPSRPVTPIRHLEWPAASQADYNIAVILPFELAATTPDAMKIQMRSVEFYQGFLVALDAIQSTTGRSFHLQVYDLSTTVLPRILAMPALADADLIVGPLDGKDVLPIAEYAEQHDINVITPFTFDLNLARKYTHLFQLNTSKTQMYSELTRDLMDRFSGYSVVFLTDSLDLEHREDYAGVLRTELERNQREYYDYPYSDPAAVGVVDSVLQLEGKNVLYVPVTAGVSALRRMFPYLQYQAQFYSTDSVASRAVLGYPEWQLYTADFVEYFYDLNVHMFTKIYINPFDPEVQTFYNQFKYWYNKDPMPIYPKYALLGYDVGKFFLTALVEHGARFEYYIEKSLVETLQSVMAYRQFENRGFINKSLYLVRFTPQTTIEKYVVR